MRFILTNTASKPLESGCFLGVSSPAEVLKKKELKRIKHPGILVHEHCPAEVLKKKELKLCSIGSPPWRVCPAEVLKKKELKQILC